MLKDKSFKVGSNPNYDGYQKGVAPMVYRFFDKKSNCGGVAALANKSAIRSMPNKQLENEINKPIVRKFKWRRGYSSFKDNIWKVDLADMQLINKYNKESRYLLRATDLFNKYAWVVALKDKKDITTVNAFQSILDSSGRKPNKIWVDQGREFF